MRRKKLLLLLVVFFAIAAVQQAAAVTKVWDLSQDFRVCPSQSNPNKDSYGNATWHFMQSPTMAHNPAAYSLLDSFHPHVYGTTGVMAWESNCCDGYYDTCEPAIGINATCEDQFNLWPAGKVRFTLGCAERMAVIGWKSPIKGSVSVDAVWTDINPGCGDGMRWYVDSGETTLATGALQPGGVLTQSYSGIVSVKNNEYIYFIVDSYGGWNRDCDEMTLDLVITQQE